MNNSNDAPHEIVVHESELGHPEILAGRILSALRSVKGNRSQPKPTDGLLLIRVAGWCRDGAVNAITSGSVLGTHPGGIAPKNRF